jgi:hypothetical protein
MRNLTRKEQLAEEARNLYLNRNTWLMDPNHEYPTMDDMTWFEQAQKDISSIICLTTGMSMEDIDVLNIPYRDFRHPTTANLYWRTVVACAEEVVVLTDHPFHAMYESRPQDLQEIQDNSIILDRPDISILSNTKFKNPIFILEVISSPNEAEELRKLIRYLLIVYEMYQLREVYGALSNAEKICFVKLNCDNPAGKQLYVTGFEHFTFRSNSAQTRKVFSLIDYFVNSTLPQNLDTN